jgi:pilus assembly protein Flp/PilA
VFACILAFFERVKVDRQGVTALEYGVIAAGIAIVVAAAAATLGGKITALFGRVGNLL